MQGPTSLLKAITYAPIFYLRPHVSPSGKIYTKAVGKMLAERINRETMDVFLLSPEGVPLEDRAVATLFEAKIDEKGSALVGKIRLHDESLRENWNPVDMSFSVAISLNGLPSSKGLVGKDIIGKIGPAVCWVNDDSGRSSAGDLEGDQSLRSGPDSS